MMVALLLIAFVCAQSLQHVHSNVVENMVARDGYVAESHAVTTEDGYILEINRIPHRKDEDAPNAKRPAVFLMHGLMASATSYILLGPEASIAYNLVDAGFDVWMGNARGVLGSRNHVQLDPNDSGDRNQFFDYSFHEIGFYDVAAMVDCVLEYTGESQLHYIGHSQGGTAFLALASSRPEYNAKFKSVHLLAGVGYQEHFPSRILGTIAQRTELIYRVTAALGYVEVLRPRNWPWLNNHVSCAGPALSEECELNFAVEALGSIIDPTRQAHGSAAVKQIVHYGQNIKEQVFRRFDHGAIRNLIEYGRLAPPNYDLRLITTDVTLHYTVNDILLDERDVLSMAAVMPNTKARKIADEQFLHSGFVFDRNVKELVTDYILEQLKRH